MNPFRRQRILHFESLAKSIDADPVRILDVGGRVEFWRDTSFWGNERYQITVANIDNERNGSPRGADWPDNIVWRYADARDFSDELERGYEVLFSNSVIEHVGDMPDIERMARQFENFDGVYFLQTPNFWFPIEPHFRMPFFAQLPYVVRVFLVRHFNLGCFRKSSSWEDAEAKVRSVRLLSVAEMELLFPSAELEREKFFGLTKSIYVHTLSRHSELVKLTNV